MSNESFCECRFLPLPQFELVLSSEHLAKSKVEAHLTQSRIVAYLTSAWIGWVGGKMHAHQPGEVSGMGGRRYQSL